MPKIPEEVAAETIEACARRLEAYAGTSEALTMIERKLIETVAQGILRDNRLAIIAAVTKPGEDEWLTSNKLTRN